MAFVITLPLMIGFYLRMNVKKFIDWFFLIPQDEKPIEEDINLVLLNLSDSSSQLHSSYFGNKVFIYDLNITDDIYDKDEANTANMRLNDIGYKILQISKGYRSEIWYASVIKSEFYDKLKSLKIKFWKDLKWKPWHLNTRLKNNAKHCLLKLSNIADEGSGSISIIDGIKNYNNNSVIEFNISFGETEEFVFNSKCEAEIELINQQVIYFNIQI